jgi:hypothetical protein
MTTGNNIDKPEPDVWAGLDLDALALQPDTSGRTPDDWDAFDSDPV